MGDISDDDDEVDPYELESDDENFWEEQFDDNYTSALDLID